MIRIRHGVALEAAPRSPGVWDVRVRVEGGEARAIAYEDLTGPVAAGDRVVLNTTALSLGLGTGGYHFVIAVEGYRETDALGEGHAIKLRYTPMQLKVQPVEETHRDVLDSFTGLDGAPVVVAGLHSALAPALIAARAVRPEVRTAFVMTEGGALPIGFSEAVPALREAGLLDATVTAGQAFGGDHEAVNRYSGIAAAHAVAGAGLVVVGMGPGNLGTGSRLGFAALEMADAINAVAALGGRPVVVPRLSWADRRERHRGLSHHTVAVLSMALASAEIALPPLAPVRAAEVRAALDDAGLLERHRLVEVDLGSVEKALEASPVPLRSMGRSYAEDPDYFRAAAAAGVHAAR